MPCIHGKEKHFLNQKATKVKYEKSLGIHWTLYKEICSGVSRDTEPSLFPHEFMNSVDIRNSSMTRWKYFYFKYSPMIKKKVWNMTHHHISAINTKDRTTWWYFFFFSSLIKAILGTSIAVQWDEQCRRFIGYSLKSFLIVVLPIQLSTNAS